MLVTCDTRVARMSVGGGFVQKENVECQSRLFYLMWVRAIIHLSVIPHPFWLRQHRRSLHKSTLRLFNVYRFLRFSFSLFLHLLGCQLFVVVTELKSQTNSHRVFIFTSLKRSSFMSHCLGFPFSTSNEVKVVLMTVDN